MSLPSNLSDNKNDTNNTQQKLSHNESELKPRTFLQLYPSVFIFQGIIFLPVILAMNFFLGGVLLGFVDVPILWWLIGAATFSRSNKEISENIEYSNFEMDQVSFRKLLIDYLVTLRPNSYKARYSNDTNLLFQWNKGLQIRARLSSEWAQVVGSKQLLDGLEGSLHSFIRQGLKVYLEPRTSFQLFRSVFIALGIIFLPLILGLSPMLKESIEIFQFFLILYLVPWVLLTAIISYGIHEKSSAKEISEMFYYSNFNTDQASFRKQLVNYFEQSFPNSYKARYSNDSDLLFQWTLIHQVKVRLFLNEAQVVGTIFQVDNLRKRLQAQASQDFEKRLENEFGVTSDKNTSQFKGRIIYDGVAGKMSSASVEWTCQALKDMAHEMRFDHICIAKTTQPMIICNTKPPIALITDLDANKLARIIKEISIVHPQTHGSMVIIKIDNLETHLEDQASQNEENKTPTHSLTATDAAKLRLRAEQIEEELPKLKKEILRAYSSSNDADMAQLIIAGIEENMKSSGSPSKSPINRSKELEEELSSIRGRLAKMNENSPLNSKVQELFKSKNVDGLRDVTRSEGNAITEFLVSALANDPDPQVKIMAIDSLGLTSDPWAVRVLIKVFEDSTGGHRETAALSLANIVANRVKSSEAVPTLMLIAKDKSIKTAFRVQAVTAICRFWEDDDAVKQFLAEIANDPSEDMDIQMAIVNNM